MSRIQPKTVGFCQGGGVSNLGLVSPKSGQLVLLCSCRDGLHGRILNGTPLVTCFEHFCGQSSLTRVKCTTSQTVLRRRNGHHLEEHYLLRSHAA